MKNKQYSIDYCLQKILVSANMPSFVVSNSTCMVQVVRCEILHVVAFVVNLDLLQIILYDFNQHIHNDRTFRISIIQRTIQLALHHAMPEVKECFFFVEQPDGSLGYAGFETLPDIVLENNFQLFSSNSVNDLVIFDSAAILFHVFHQIGATTDPKVS